MAISGASSFERGGPFIKLDISILWDGQVDNSRLIIFVDSLPFSYVDRMPFLSKADMVCEITPGVGYSINLHPELFGGYRPDDVGFFCEWTYKPAESDFLRISPILVALHALSLHPVGDRIVRKLLKRLIGPTFQIPLRYLDRFRRCGIGVFAPDFPLPTIFSRTNDLTLVLPYEGIKEKRDERAYFEARTRIQTHLKLFVAFPDLDSIGHRYRVGSPKYDDRVQELDSWIQALTETFLYRRPDGRVVVLSDHGMANVNRGYQLTIESDIGPARREAYTFFLDSTILRIWIHDEDLRDPMTLYLHCLGVGAILDSETRSRYGLRKKEWGDIIYILDEGIVFHPSFLSSGVPKAMHGYHPELASQKAVLALIGAPFSHISAPHTAVEVAALLSDLLL
ncbi:MAG: alkaline phosphatase family protein [Promethearchaeota archaeon]